MLSAGRAVAFQEESQNIVDSPGVDPFEMGYKMHVITHICTHRNMYLPSLLIGFQTSIERC